MTLDSIQIRVGHPFLHCSLVTMPLSLIWPNVAVASKWSLKWCFFVSAAHLGHQDKDQRSTSDGVSIIGEGTVTSDRTSML